MKLLKRKVLISFRALLTVVSVCGFVFPDTNLDLNTIRIANEADMKRFFSYSPDRIPFVSAHRGGPKKGFPENCLPTFENTLKKVHALLEIDPHYTRDSAIVLMHDPTLDRTSTGHGKVSDYTLSDLRKLKLKDTEGNITPYGIPTLDETLEWAKGKTVLVLDMKDVPMQARVRKIMEHRAEANAIVMAYSNADAQTCYRLNPNIHMEVMLGTMEKVLAFDKTGVPWQNVVVFLSHTLPADATLLNEIHKRGAMCIVGTSRNYDVQYAKGEIKSAGELNEAYQQIIKGGFDIIEADLAIEAGTALKYLQSDRNSSKIQFFK